MSVIDLQGKVLVGVGWQPIGLNFHRGSFGNLQALPGERHATELLGNPDITGNEQGNPCYCFCDAMGHKSLLNCFFEKGEGGMQVR